MASEPERFDELDKRLLDILQRGMEATPNVTSIAKKLGKPTATVHSRIKRLEKSGVVTGYRAVFEESKIDRGKTVFLLITTSKEKGDPKTTIKKWLEMPEVKEIHFTSGDSYFLVKVRVKSLEEMYELESRIWSEQLEFIESIVAFKSFKEETSHLLDF